MANTQKVEIRVSFTRDTTEGEYSDCIIYQLSDFLTNPENVKIGTGKVLTDITDRTNNWVQTITEMKSNAVEPVQPTDDELFVEFDIDTEKRARLEQWLRGKGYIAGDE